MQRVTAVCWHMQAKQGAKNSDEILKLTGGKFSTCMYVYTNDTISHFCYNFFEISKRKGICFRKVLRENDSVGIFAMSSKSDFLND